VRLQVTKLERNTIGSVATLQECFDKLGRYGSCTLSRRAIQMAPIRTGSHPACKLNFQLSTLTFGLPTKLQHIQFYDDGPGRGSDFPFGLVGAVPGTRIFHLNLRPVSHN
jgi:hypothetical protein